MALWCENDLERFSLKQALHEVESSVLFATITEAFLSHIPSTCSVTRGNVSLNHLSFILLEFLPPQGFGPEAKIRGGTLGVPGCIHTRTNNIC